MHTLYKYAIVNLQFNVECLRLHFIKILVEHLALFQVLNKWPAAAGSPSEICIHYISMQ